MKDILKRIMGPSQGTFHEPKNGEMEMNSVEGDWEDIERSISVSELSHQEHKLQVIERMLEEDTLHCLDGNNVRFGSVGAATFCAYYSDNPSGEKDLYLKVFAHDRSATFRINERAISHVIADHYAPELLLLGEKEYVLLAALVERDTTNVQRGVVRLEICKLSVDSQIKISRVKSVGLTSVEEKRDQGLYEYPVSMIRDDKGNILVVAKTLGDMRANSVDQVYAMWKITGTDFNVMKFRNRRGSINSGYLFRRGGYNVNAGADRLRVMSAELGMMDMVYVGRYLEGRSGIYKTFYKVYRSTVRYGNRMRAEGCFVDRPGCSIGSNKIVAPSIGKVHLMDSTQVAGINFVASIADIEGSTSLVQQLAMIVYHGSDQVVLCNFANFDSPVRSLNIVSGSDLISVVAVAARKIIVYRLSPVGLINNDMDHVSVDEIDINLLNENELARICAGDVLSISNSSELVSEKLVQVLMSRNNEVAKERPIKMLVRSYGNYTALHQEDRSELVNTEESKGASTVEPQGETISIVKTTTPQAIPTISADVSKGLQLPISGDLATSGLLQTTTSKSATTLNRSASTINSSSAVNGVVHKRQSAVSATSTHRGGALRNGTTKFPQNLGEGYTVMGRAHSAGKGIVLDRRNVLNMNFGITNRSVGGNTTDNNSAGTGVSALFILGVATGTLLLFLLFTALAISFKRYRSRRHFRHVISSVENPNAIDRYGLYDTVAFSGDLALEREDTNYGVGTYTSGL